MKKLNLFFMVLAISGIINSFSIEQKEEKLDSSEKVETAQIQDEAAFRAEETAQIQDEAAFRAEMERRLQEIVSNLNDEEKKLIQKGIGMVAKHVETLYGTDEEFKQFVDWAKTKGLDIQIVINLLPTIEQIKQDISNNEDVTKVA
jgi:hypothetical protein